MPPLARVVTSGVMRKMQSIHEVKHVTIPKLIRDMAVRVAGELQAHELNYGAPSDLEPVTVDIGRITGNLARSFGFTQLGKYTWAVQQTLAIAPYAGDVADYAQRRFGMTYMDSVRRRTHDFLLNGAKEEWERAWRLINADRSYKYQNPYAE